MRTLVKISFFIVSFAIVVGCMIGVILAMLGYHDTGIVLCLVSGLGVPVWIPLYHKMVGTGTPHYHE